MLGPVDYAIWLAAFFANVGCLVCIIKGKAFFRYFTLVLFLSASTVIGVGRYVILFADGFTSRSYFYFYYYSDTVLTVCLFFVLMSFYSQVFSEMGVSKLMRAGAMLILGGTAFISYQMIASSSDRMVTRFAIELSQNLYFVAVVLTYLLWGAMMKLRENRTRLMQLVLGMGVYLSVFAASYAMSNMYPYLALWRYFIALMAIWLPATWAYTFLKIPEDSRMATARVVAPTP
jgi:hypothetical protein